MSDILRPRLRTITVTWRAFRSHASENKSPETSATFQFRSDLPDLSLCELAFMDTNQYMGPLWSALEPVLPADRTHTALSVVFDCGDYVTIDGVTYEVAGIGFRKVTQ